LRAAPSNNVTGAAALNAYKLEAIEEEADEEARDTMNFQQMRTFGHNYRDPTTQL
jgi:hypothetical protein